MNPWIEGQIVQSRRWTNSLYSLTIDASIERFEAGQHTHIGLDFDGGRVSGLYSLVNAPHEPYVEIYSFTASGKLLSNQLRNLKRGASVWVTPICAGSLTLSKVPEADYLWMLCTGTALSPFLSMLKTDEPWRRFKKIMLVHAVRRAEELNYQNSIEWIHAARNGQLVVIPFVSREDTNFALRGRIPGAIEDGRLEERAGQSLRADDSQVMICGNKGMVTDASNVLMARGLKKNKRGKKGHITTEDHCPTTYNPLLKSVSMSIGSEITFGAIRSATYSGT